MKKRVHIIAYKFVAFSQETKPPFMRYLGIVQDAWSITHTEKNTS